ncbi:glycosyltransferase [bacterium]|nr:glycosyltransferase [bacterium]
MKVLWFSPTPALYSNKVWGHNGGGWITSLQNIVQSVENVDLGIAFESAQKATNEVFDSVKYYPIVGDFGIREKFKQDNKLKKLLDKSIAIINDFNPDIIHLFGSEQWYGLLVKHTNIPIVIHMQGSLPSYYNVRYPVGMSVWNKIFSTKTSFMQKLMAFRIDATFHKNALQEESILKANHYFMGRTHWDKAIVNFYNPKAKYFVCQEALRDSFIKSEQKWAYKESNKIKLISVISGPLYKGVDVVLKTAKLLKENTQLDFEWSICGTGKCDLIESTYNIKARDVNVHILGVLSEDKLNEQLLNSSFYVHPSYIDNSPNSVCEAQILGIPVIATNTGGLSTLIKDNVTGFLVPANDPLMIAFIIIENYSKKKLLQQMSEASIESAMERHDPVKIKRDLISVYKQVIDANTISNGN